LRIVWLKVEPDVSLLMEKTMTSSAVATAPIDTIRSKLSEWIQDWQERREERRLLLEFDKDLLRELTLTRSRMRRHYREMRFTQSWKMV
jgi:hypothetical protein